MFLKLALLSLVAITLAQHQLPAAQYPAGVNPQDCPDFPICDNARLHSGAAKWQQQQPQQHQPSWQQQSAWQQQPAWQPQPHSQSQWQLAAAQNWQSNSQWNAPSQQSWQSQPQWKSSAPTAHAAEMYPAGVNPHTCPNYPYCDVNAGAAPAAPAHAAPLPGFTERLYPAGVSPHACPNFPYCK